MMTVIDGVDSVDSEDSEDSEVGRRTENEENIMEWMGMTGTDGESTANHLERNSRSELYYSDSHPLLLEDSSSSRRGLMSSASGELEHDAWAED